jgi:ATP-binding cassette subfamily B protein
LLISYLVYVTRFYDPLRQIASLFSDLQSALAGWDRITEILEKQTDLLQLPATGEPVPGAPVMEFRDVSFAYPGGDDVLSEISFSLEAGKTYAFVGPTGGGKTTTASLMARLFDARSGQVLLQGRDIRSISPGERAARIGFILQDPFLFGGTVGENILYGNPLYEGRQDVDVAALLREEGLETLMSRFDEGVETPVVGSGETLSLGQKQLIAFMRAALRKPDLLILDEATANIDTVTEELLEEILQRLPATTTRVIIAHRLNTIENADQIYFVNGGSVVLAGSMQEAIDLLEYRTRTS